MEVCAKCGSKPVYRTVSVGDYDDPTATQRVADHCSNPICEYYDPSNVDYDTFVTR